MGIQIQNGIQEGGLITGNGGLGASNSQPIFEI